MHFTFNKKYFSAAVAFFLVEIFIALYVKDALIRPYVGDYLVVFLLYCLVKSFLNISVKKAIFGVLLFSYFVEGLQYFNVTGFLGLKENQFISIILGSYFEWLDIFIYTLAALSIFWIELAWQRSFLKQETEA